MKICKVLDIIQDFCLQKKRGAHSAQYGVPFLKLNLISKEMFKVEN